LVSGKAEEGELVPPLKKYSRKGKRKELSVSLGGKGGKTGEKMGKN